VTRSCVLGHVIHSKQHIRTRPVRRHSEGQRRRLTALSPAAAAAARTNFVGGGGAPNQFCRRRRNFVVGGGGVYSTNDRYSTICDYKSDIISSFLVQFSYTILSSGSFGNNMTISLHIKNENVQFMKHLVELMLRSDRHKN
jgi:hypothetical protein